ncbi:MAG: glycosyltransferase family 1 protein [Gemmatimonas sp.]|uniref:glycosyltransferase family 4 protein n=1 Tax=Gemmatimonas sp. TaxID=1962908 RepID=UPI0025BB1995|nr:glycosyltransferase family 1 protein [Gemmatimonas sp.]MCA2989006.1 glycosyltransferase family 1 protein [Gemmatimonas sp.]
MPRLLVCTDSYPPQLNGVSVVTAAMVTGLSARGWECAVLAPAYPPALTAPLSQPVTLRHVALPSRSLPAYRDVRLVWPPLRHARQIVRDFRPDVVHCATEFTVGWAGLRAARAYDVPVVTTHHTDFSRYCDAYGVPFLRPVVQRWLGRFHRRAHHTIAPSAAVERTLRAMHVGHTTVWGGGVDTTHFSPRHFSLLSRHRYAMGADFNFLHVGRLAPEKNVEFVLDAFAHLRNRFRDRRLRLIIAGAGPSERRLRERAGDDVMFLGAVDRERDLPALYASADGFVTASETETLGLVVLEAMASGLPVVACHAAGVGEHLDHARNGLAFAPGDMSGCVSAMSRLVADASLHERLRAGARAAAESMSTDRALDQLDALLRTVVGAAAVSYESSPSPLVMTPAR